MRIADLEFGVNVQKGFRLQNMGDTSTSVYNAEALERWKAGKDENLEVVLTHDYYYEVPAFEKAWMEYTKGKAAMLKQWGTTE